nr:hypothetical protein [Brucella anthropi]
MHAWGIQMETLASQFIGGIAGGLVSSKIFHASDIGGFWNTVSGALGGVAGGQLIGAILGKTTAATGFDAVGIIGSFIDSALSGALVQIAAGLILQRLLNRRSVRDDRRSLNS